jgi:hypothetical protein
MANIEEIKKALTEILSQYFPQKTSWIDKSEAKRLLGIKSDTTLFDLREDNVIRFTRHGRIIMYDKDSLTEYLEKFANYDKAENSK